MKKKLSALILAVLMLSGCAWMPDDLDELEELENLSIPGLKNEENEETEGTDGSGETGTGDPAASEGDPEAVGTENPADPAVPAAEDPAAPAGSEPAAPTEEAPSEETSSEETPAAETPAVQAEKPPFDTDDPASSGTSENKYRVTSLTLDKYDVRINVGLTDMPWVTMLPSNAENKAELWNSSDTNVAIVDQYGRITGVSEGTCTVTVASQDNPDCKAEVSVTVIPMKNASEVTYINGILVANKTYGLPASYNPGVDPDAQKALDELIAGGAADGLEFFVRSGFRSYDTQMFLYNTYVGRDGKDEADRYSARPGFSEHQTGLAFDMNSLDSDFGQTAEGLWLAEHCWEYGFVIRYAADKEAITGYMYEPWHIRYFGKDLAKELHESGQCLEEYLGIVSQYMD